MDRKERIHYYDVARGFLIIMVVYYHTMLQADIPFCTHIWNQFAFISFFMAGFFIITGLVTNFQHDTWLQFLWKKFKGIVIPTVTFLFVQHWLPFLFDPTIVPKHFGIPLEIFQGKMPWFIVALFFSLIINYALIRYIKKKSYILLASLTLFLIGVVSHVNGWIYYENGDVYCINHILVMNIFLTIGYLLRDIKLHWWYMLITIPLYEAIILSTNFLSFGIPFVTGGTLYVEFVNMIPYLIMAICGSITLLVMCRIISENSTLEYVGRNSLSIYIIQAGLVTPMLNLLLLGQYGQSLYNRTIIFFFIVILIIVISALISQFLNSKYLKWSMGKF